MTTLTPMPPPNPERTSQASNAEQPETAKQVDEQSLASVAHNWYAKLHPIGAPTETMSSANSDAKSIATQPLNLSIFFRIWLAVAVIIILSSVVAFTQLFEYVKPTTQQVIEDTLVDTSKLLAVSLRPPMQTGLLYNDDYQTTLDQAFIGRKPSKANTLKLNPNQQRSANTPTPWYHLKTHSSFRVYVTDSQGVVIYDSRQGDNNAEGQDYSRWNDVYLTLQGQYGARSTAQRPGDSTSSVMYVAQPIESADGALLGVVSVGKPVATIVPYLEATRSRMLTALLVISALALIMAGLVAWWLKQSMALVARYTRSLAKQTDKPYFYLGRELNELSDTIEGMKDRLENRAYVTDYVHTLTHELKSPLTAIRASGELLEDPSLEEEDRLMLSQTITEQSIKLQSLIDRLLLLATVEQPTFKLQKELLDLPELLQSLLTLAQAKLQQRQLSEIPLWINEQPIASTKLVQNAALDQSLTLFADKFWLSQALQNVLDNAIYFAQSQVIINLRPHSNSLQIDIFNDGAPIPEYALAKVFDRYFSLSHQAIFASDVSQPRMQAKKGTGLGLTLVKQVIEHHGGEISIRNISKDILRPLTTEIEAANATLINQPTNGVLVTIELPLAAPIPHD
ncbi:two-component system sensor histidine kinase CreC [Psychrobacter arenosus]|uniref:two-component system sensor histidine kinase CreC n=1 Tax=Psychrobacter arenosus TaxID=256326 RepID=UPI001D0FDEC5|nr:two-component system sensor histidine kinase CreC [Psychrobacter arenosus]